MVYGWEYRDARTPFYNWAETETTLGCNFTLMFFMAEERLLLQLVHGAWNRRLRLNAADHERRRRWYPVSAVYAVRHAGLGTVFGANPACTPRLASLFVLFESASQALSLLLW